MRKEELEKELRDILFEIKNSMQNNTWDNTEANKKMWDKMVDYAHLLDGMVKPKHHAYMLKNRKVPQADKEFYNHIHPVEDLLAFINDPHANEDPIDITINHDFELNLYSRRWGHDDKYHIKRIYNGWEIGNLSFSGTCDKTGFPYLYQNLDHDNINYPEALPEYLEWLWEQAADKGLTHEQVQTSLDQLSNWVNDVESSSPKGIWENYK